MTDPNEPTHDRAELERDILSINQLNALGNEAIACGLIVGHGYHQGQYEILHKGEAVTLTPEEAVQYLRALLQSAPADGE